MTGSMRSKEGRSQPIDDELWCLKTVVSKTGLSRASIYRYVARNLFPPRRRIGIDQSRPHLRPHLRLFTGEDVAVLPPAITVAVGARAGEVFASQFIVA